MPENKLKKCKNCGKLNDPDATQCSECSQTDFDAVPSVEVDGNFNEGE